MQKQGEGSKTRERQAEARRHWCNATRSSGHLAQGTAGGFRQYADADVETLGFIRQAQGLGFTLKEVRELLKLRHERLQPCAPVQRRLQRKLSDVRGKLAELERLKRELQSALNACNKEWRKKSRRCPLLSSGKSRSGK
jgi:DNA-binding transcriptional MerR regulator